MDNDPLHAMPLEEIRIRYSLDDQGTPTVGVDHEGDGSLVTLLGMLKMAEDTILSPEWGEAREED